MSNPVATATGWRDALSNAAGTLNDTLRDLATTQLEDLESVLSTIESEMDDVVSSIPCEEGLVEFVEELERGDADVHDECYLMDDVAVTTDDLRNGSGGHHWDTVQSNQLIRFKDMADTLETVLEGTRIRWTRRAVQGMIAQLRDESFVPDQDLADYLDDNTEVKE